MEQFENSNDRVAVVVNSSDKVVGVISQGDILRALSAGIGMYKQVNQIIQSSFLHLYSRNMEEAYEIFKKKKITLLPVISYDNELQSIITLDDIFEYLENKKA